MNLKKINQTGIIVVAILLLGIISCKKELYKTEKIDLAQRAKIAGYLKEPKIETISLSSFTKEVNMASLGNLKNLMFELHDRKTGKTMGKEQPVTGTGRYKINVDSAKLLIIDGRRNYIFSIAPVTPRAVTFRNLTISKKGSTISAFLTTYTPTRRWAKNYVVGKKEKFQGKVDLRPINLNDDNLLTMGQISTTTLPRKASAQKTMQVGRVANGGLDNCTPIPIYGQEPYYCASGTHGPEDTCYLTGSDRAGYVTVVMRIEYDCAGGGSEGGGGTTPGPPGDYNPCDQPIDDGSPGENQVPNTEIDQPLCDPVNDDPPNEDEIKDEIENKPFALFDSIDCQTLKKWLAVAKFTPPPSVINDLGHLTALATNQGFYILKTANIQKLDDAHSTIVNMDYFSVTVNKLPTVNGQQLDAGQLLKYIRTNINSFTGGTEQFNPYNAYGLDDRSKWASTNPLGAIVNIDIPGPDNGSVITSYSATNRWTFTTIHEPMYGDHPVSGNRNFGYTTNPNGSYTFYTQGVDRLTSWDGTSAQNIPEFFITGSGIPFNKADALWTTFQHAISNFVKSHQGTSNVNPSEILRPNWQKLKDVLNGKKPLSILSKNCPD